MSELLKDLPKISLPLSEAPLTSRSRHLLPGSVGSEIPPKRRQLAKGDKKDLPESSGIYVFFNEQTPIYIGKAINLKRRLSSYFDLDLEIKTERMVKEADEISYIKVTSELEALLLEAKLIRTYMPKYNIAAKDDKHPLYIVITKEKYPRVLAARKLIANDYKLIASYGPFPSSGSVRSVMRMIRRIFPYSDHKLGKRGCLYSHIGLCNPCPNNIESSPNQEELRKKYVKNVRNIKAILDGRALKVREALEKEMKLAAKEEKYEGAKELRDQMQRLDYITKPQMPIDVFMENPNLYEDIREKELRELLKLLKNYKLEIKNCTRIECYDIAHLAGTSPTASMVTFTGAEPDKKYYRHFKIYQKKSQSDIDSLKEIIQRRLKHLEDWGRPDLIIVDGGKAQTALFVRELEEAKIPVVGLAKRFETLVIPTHIDGTVSLKEYRIPKGAVLNLVQRIRDEAHRFARRLHHKLISKNFNKN